MLAEFFESCATRSAMICALLAVLELVRLQAIVLVQGELFGSITLRKHKAFGLVFAGGEAARGEGAAPEPAEGGTSRKPPETLKDIDEQYQ